MDNVIHFQDERASRFYWTLCQAIDAVESLALIKDQFPPISLGAGEVHPQLAVEAFATVIRERLNLLLSMVDGEDVQPAKLQEAA